MTAQPTAGTVWRKKAREGALIDLPSGNTARVRNVPISLFFTQAPAITNSLMGVVGEFINKKEGEKAEDAITNLINTKAKEFFEFVDIVCRLAFVSPRIVDTPQGEDEIAVTDLEDADKMAVIQLLGMPAEQLEPFCQEFSKNVATVQRISEVYDTSIGDDKPTNPVS